MTPTLALLVLLAALFHATWNAIVKGGDDKLLSITGLNLASAIICALLLPFFGLPDPDSYPLLIISAIVHFGYYIALSKAYAQGDFSQAYPIARGTAPLFVTLWGVLVLGEFLSLLEAISLAGILGGILLFATRGWDAVSRDHKALFWALATSLCIAAYTITDGLGGRLSGNVPGYMFALGVLDSIFIIVYTSCVRGVPAVVGTLRQWKLNFFSGGLSIAAYTLVVWVMTQAPIPLVSALRETSIVIAALIGAFYFKEPSGKRRIIASLIIFVSVVLLGFNR